MKPQPGNAVFGLALLSAAGFLFAFVMMAGPQFLYEHRRALLHGSVLEQPTSSFPFTNIQALGMLAGGVGVSVFCLMSMLLQSGGKALGASLANATREVKLNQVGLERLHKELSRQ